MRRSLYEIAGLIALGVASRLIPHYPNMTAISAVALKSRARFGACGLCIPLASMALSDAIIGFYNWKLLVSVYVSFAVVGLLGAFVQYPSAWRISGISIIGSTLFFFITNTSVWALSQWYPHSPEGLLACLAAGLPFFYPMLLGDIVFSLAVFRGSENIKTLARKRVLMTEAVQ